MNNQVKRMQQLAGLLTESEYNETKENSPEAKSVDSVSEGLEIVVKDLTTLKKYFAGLGGGTIPVSLDSKESVELYNYIKDYIAKGKKASIANIAKTAKVGFDRGTKSIKS